MVRRSIPPPPSDEAWDRRTLEGTDPESGEHRDQLRKLAAVSDVLLEMAQSRERWKVFRSMARRFILVTAALVAGLSAFKSEILDLIRSIRGG